MVDLWESKLLAFGGVNGSLGQISKGSSVDHVSDDVLLDGFVFWDPGGTGLASDEFDVASAFLVTSVVSSLLGHLGKFILTLLKVENRWYFFRTDFGILLLFQRTCFETTFLLLEGTKMNKFIPVGLSSQQGYLWNLCIGQSFRLGRSYRLA